MERSHVRTFILWMNKAGVKADEWEFFTTAYFNVYNEASPRCKWCFDLYIRKGVVPEFVQIFIQRHVVYKGVKKCKRNK